MLTEESSAEFGVEHKVEGHAEAQQKRVLVVEDDPVFARVVERWLERPALEGLPRFHATRVGSLQEAVRALAVRRFDAIVLDLGLPDSTGTETLTSIRQVSSLPVVILTAIGDEQFASRLVGLGAQDYLNKEQADAERLQRCLNYALERHELEMALRRQNRALRALGDCNRVVGRAQNRDSLLRDVCEVVVQRSGYRFAWIGALQEGPPREVVPLAFAGEAPSYLRQIRILVDDPLLARGPVGRAVREGKPHTVSDVASDPDFAPWRQAALSHGYRSVVALPLRTKGGFCGALVVYAAEAGAFHADATALLEELAANLSVGLERIEAFERQARSERERKLVEARYRSLAEVAPVGILHVTPRGRCTYVNDRLCEMSQQPPSELLGHGWRRLVRPEDLARLLEEWTDQGGRGVFRTELRVVRTNGEERWLSLHLAPVSEEERHLGFAGAVVDVTDRKRMEEALERANRTLETRVRERTRELEETIRELESFTHSLAHDIRAPVRRVVAFCELLLLRCADSLPEQAKHYAVSARENAMRVGRLLEELLGLARVRSRPLNRQTVDFSALCLRVLRSLLEGEPSRTVRWEVEQGLTLFADPRLMEIVAWNLLDNAWKYTRPRAEGRIWVGSSVEDGERWIYVRDNGVGFDPRYSENLFRPFSRLHREEEFEGTGIGLTTVYRIVARHGGKIRAEGRPGEGATFSWTLPATVDAAQAVEPMAAVDGEAALQNPSHSR